MRKQSSAEVFALANEQEAWVMAKVAAITRKRGAFVAYQEAYDRRERNRPDAPRPAPPRADDVIARMKLIEPVGDDL